MMPTKYIITRKGNRLREYFVDITAERLPITTRCEKKAIALSMGAAITIAQDLDHLAGKYPWRVVPQPDQPTCTCTCTTI